jgi:sugar phosphate isomerase/epimerase
MNSSANELSTRRAFLTRGTGAVLGTVLLQSLARQPAAAAPAPRRAKPNLRFGFTSYQWGKDWDIPTMIANCTKAKVYGVELRTSDNYAHKLELTSPAAQRAEARKRFADSPVKLVGIASAERFDWPDPAKLKAAIEAAKAHLQLSHDVGASGVRVFPNQFQKDVPKEQTLAQIARAVNEVGVAAERLGQEVRLEAHGNVGELPNLRTIMDQVRSPAVRIKLNSDARDTQGLGFEKNFELVRPFLGHTVHLHNLKDEKFPYQLQVNLLYRAGWDGWALLEVTDKVPDRVVALAEQREIWDRMVAKAAQA